jgi:N-acetylmuramic acid 6-phosphate (MurNAc-6-P) etherase
MSRITEQSNPITSTLDEDSNNPLNVLQKFRRVDAEMCAGLLDASTSTAIDRLCSIVHASSSTKNVHVIVSGAGTSGRVAHLAARRANQLCQTIQWHYICAGGDKALIEAQEHSEDDVELARNDLRRLVTSTQDDEALIVFIGITCGMSAPYVAAQLDECLSLGSRLVPVLIGFNPIEASRSVKIEGWDRSFRDVVDAHVAAGHIVINPMLGPEAVAGSTRMKGGSATKILLDILATRFIHQESNTMKLIDHVTCAIPRIYDRLDRLLPTVMASAAQSLRANAHVYYVGVDVLGLWSIVDASECPPTFGAVFGDIQGFVDGGWATQRNVGGDLSLLPETIGKNQYRISVDNFRADIKLTEADTVIFLCFAQDVSLVFDVKPSKSFTLTFDKAGLTDAENDLSLLELECKLALNAISTFAWIANGKVFGNRMIDLAISNNKLYFRAQTIVRDVLSSSAAAADVESAVLRAIYDVNDSVEVDRLRGVAVSEHVHAAFKAKANKVKVVPIAVMLASGLAKTTTQAKEMLQKTILRNLIEAAKQKV